LQAAAADNLVRALYSSFPTETVREMVEIGKRSQLKDPEGILVVRTFTEALQREVDRRKRVASDGSR
jgi:hypothetical protein